MKLVLLGTGTPEASLTRASSGDVVDLGDQRIQFDCGGGSFNRLLEVGYEPGYVDTLFISHLHSDHMMDYARLVHARWDRGAGLVPEHTVFAPQPFDGMSGKLFGTDGVFARDLAARCRHPASQEVHEMRGGSLPRRWPAPEIHQIHDGFCHSESGWTVRAVSVPHAQPYLDCFAFRIDASGGSIVYSGDSGPSPALTELAEGADIPFHMCFQFSGEARSHEWLGGRQVISRSPSARTGPEWQR